MRLDRYLNWTLLIILLAAVFPPLIYACLQLSAAPSDSKLNYWRDQSKNQAAKERPRNWMSRTEIAAWDYYLALVCLLITVSCIKVYQRFRWIKRVQRWNPQERYCPKCGYDARFSGDRCSECGTFLLPKTAPAKIPPRPH